MFKWSYECAIEVNVPLRMAWDFFINPDNWPKWEKYLESCTLDGKFVTGAKVKGRIRCKPAHLWIAVTEVVPYHEYKTLVNTFLSSQEVLHSFQEIASDKTRITLQVYVFSVFMPFIKSTLFKNMEESRIKCIQAFAEIG